MATVDFLDKYSDPGPFYLGEPTRAPRIAPAARGPARWEEDFDPREGTEGTDLSQPLPEYEFDQRVSG